METPMLAKRLKFSLGVNHTTKALDVAVVGVDDAETKGALSIDDIDRLMADLSFCQYALVLSDAGGEQLMPPFDSARPFEAEGGYIVGKLDTVLRFTIAVEGKPDNVALQVLGSSGRLSCYRMSPEKARQMAATLCAAADQIPAQPNQPFDA